MMCLLKPVVEECVSITVKDVVGQFDQRPEAVQIQVEGHEQVVHVRSNGRRPYLICPDCRGLKGKLYVLPGGWELKCKDCHGLRYLGQMTSRSKEFKAVERVEGLELDGALAEVRQVCREVDRTLGTRERK